MSEAERGDSGAGESVLSQMQPHHRSMLRVEPVSDAQRAAFLEAYRACGVVGEAAKAAGFSRKTAYHQRSHNEEFAAAWEAAKAEAERHRLDAIEEHAQRVASEGWERPVYQRGEVVGSYMQPEPRLMMYMLERRRGGAYGAARSVDVNVTQVARVELSDEDRALLEPLKRRLLLGDQAEVLEGEVVSEDASGGSEPA
jgi:hypothetical protein